MTHHNCTHICHSSIYTYVFNHTKIIWSWLHPYENGLRASLQILNSAQNIILVLYSVVDDASDVRSQASLRPCPGQLRVGWKTAEWTESDLLEWLQGDEYYKGRKEYLSIIKKHNLPVWEDWTKRREVLHWFRLMCKHIRSADVTYMTRGNMTSVIWESRGLWHARCLPPFKGSIEWVWESSLLAWQSQWGPTCLWRALATVLKILIVSSLLFKHKLLI